MASLMLLGREDVQGELKLTDDQKAKLDSLREGARDKFRSAFTEVRTANENASPEDMQKAIQVRMQSLMEDMASDVLKVLEPDQKKRLTELYVQSAGSLAVVQADVSKELEITPAQKAKIDDLQRLQDEANQGIFEKAQNGEIDREEIPTMMQKNSKIMDDSIAKILTEKQRTRLKELGGKPFEFKDPKPGTPGSFGRPGGG